MGVLGMGGLFFRSKDPEALSAWYKEHLGVGGGCVAEGADDTPNEWVWTTRGGPMVFQPFKAETDYLRDSPSIDVARRLCERGAVVRAFDPAAGEKAGLLVPQLDITADPYEAAQGADVIAVMTEWDEFRWLDFALVRDGMRRPHVVDSRNLLDPAAMRRMGFSYDGVGRR